MFASRRARQPRPRARSSQCTGAHAPRILSIICTLALAKPIDSAACGAPGRAAAAPAERGPLRPMRRAFLRDGRSSADWLIGAALRRHRRVSGETAGINRLKPGLLVCRPPRPSKRADRAIGATFPTTSTPFICDRSHERGCGD